MEIQYRGLEVKMDKAIEKYQITEYPWTTNGYTPKVEITFGYDKDGFEVLFTIYENEIRAIETEHQTDVYCDSCVEFFVQFSPLTDKTYINFEANANGAMFCAKGTARENRTLISVADIRDFNIHTKREQNYWQVGYFIPLAFIQREIPSYEHKENATIKCNFYKCGAKTKYPHHGCWKKVETPKPDFYRPEFFGEIRL